MTAKGATQRLAEYIAEARYEDLPSETVEHAKELIFDAVGCAMGGRKTIEGQTLIDIMREMGDRPEATVIGEGTDFSFIHAAQVNSVLTNMLDFDDTIVKIGHIGTTLIPLALAVGEHVKAGGREVLNALVLGYEVVIRIREATEPTEAVFWNTSERGIGAGIPLGVTVVAGKLFGLEGGQMADALGLTGRASPSRITMPDVRNHGMPRWMKITGGDIILPGTYSVLLANKGFPGDRGLLDQGRGYETALGSDRYDAEKLTADLGKKYRILRIGLKYYPACRHISPTLDAVAKILSENDLHAEDVRDVIVHAQRFVARDFSIYGPEYMIQAQFSVPYTVAMVLMREPPGPAWYTDRMMQDPKVKEIQHRVHLVEDPEIQGKYYKQNRYTSTVEILTDEGGHFTEHIEYPRGEPENPFSKEDHRKKFTNMATWLGMKQGRIDEIIDTLDRIDDLSNITNLTRLLVPAG